MKAVHEERAAFTHRYGTQEHLLHQCVLFLLAQGQDVPLGGLDAAGIDTDVAALAIAVHKEGGRVAA